MQNQHRVKKQLAAVIAVGAVLTACQVSAPAKAARTTATPPTAAKVNKDVEVTVVLLKDGQPLKKFSFVARPGEMTKLAANWRGWKDFRWHYVLVDGEHFQELPASVKVDQAHQHFVFKVVPRRIRQQQVHDVVVEIRHLGPDGKLIANAPKEEAKFTVTADYYFNRLNQLKESVKYQITPGNMIVYHPHDLPGYRVVKSGGFEMHPTKLVNSPDQLKWFYDNDSQEPIRFSQEVQYERVADQQQTADEKPAQAQEQQQESTAKPAESKDQQATASGKDTDGSQSTIPRTAKEQDQAGVGDEQHQDPTGQEDTGDDEAATKHDQSQDQTTPTTPALDKQKETPEKPAGDDPAGSSATQDEPDQQVNPGKGATNQGKADDQQQPVHEQEDQDAGVSTDSHSQGEPEETSSETTSGGVKQTNQQDSGVQQPTEKQSTIDDQQETPAAHKEPAAPDQETTTESTHDNLAVQPEKPVTDQEGKEPAEPIVPKKDDQAAAETTKPTDSSESAEQSGKQSSDKQTATVPKDHQETVEQPQEQPADGSTSSTTETTLPEKDQSSPASGDDQSVTTSADTDAPVSQDPGEEKDSAGSAKQPDARPEASESSQPTADEADKQTAQSDQTTAQPVGTNPMDTTGKGEDQTGGIGPDQPTTTDHSDGQANEDPISPTDYNDIGTDAPTKQGAEQAAGPDQEMDSSQPEQPAGDQGTAESPISLTDEQSEKTNPVADHDEHSEKTNSVADHDEQSSATAKPSEDEHVETSTTEGQQGQTSDQRSSESPVTDDDGQSTADGETSLHHEAGQTEEQDPTDQVASDQSTTKQHHDQKQPADQPTGHEQGATGKPAEPSTTEELTPPNNQLSGEMAQQPETSPAEERPGTAQSLDPVGRPEQNQDQQPTRALSGDDEVKPAEVTPKQERPVQQESESNPAAHSAVLQETPAKNEQNTAGPEKDPDQQSADRQQGLAAEREKLKELDQQVAPASANDRLPQTGNNLKTSVWAAMSGLLVGIFSLLVSVVKRHHN